MKKKLQIVLLFTTLIFALSSCSNDDNENSSNSQIVGTWGTKWNNSNTIYPKFTFLSNGNVKYYTYFIGTTPELEEIGTWNLNGAILTMNFPETVELKFKNKIIFTSENEIEFEEVEDQQYDTWGAETYFKTVDPNLN